jgi:hypothetical protein
MGRRAWSLFSSSLLAGVLVCSLCPGARAGNEKGSEAGQFCDVSVVVLRASDDRPVRNAGVVLRPLQSDGNPGSDAYELKTNREGRVAMNGLPCGPLRVQVIAHRMRTFGGDFQISGQSQEIVVRLEAPAGQVSAYE